MARESEVKQKAKIVGVALRMYSPGDGVTRYRFFRIVPAMKDTHFDYFGPFGSLDTVLGAKAALDWLEAFHLGWLEGVRQHRAQR